MRILSSELSSHRDFQKITFENRFLLPSILVGLIRYPNTENYITLGNLRGEIDIEM